MLESRDIPYHLPKPGILNNGVNFQNIYTYNRQSFRKRGDVEWLTWNELQSQGGNCYAYGTLLKETSFIRISSVFTV